MFLVFLTGISCKEEIKLKKERASMIPVIIENIRFEYGLGTELLQARHNGVLSEYQFSIWMDVYGKKIGINDADRISFRDGKAGMGAEFENVSIEELNTYRSQDWAFYDNHAYTGDWEMGLWQLVE
jgi:hypothetical protein